MNNFATLHNRRARKTHTCFECHGEITPGEKYILLTGRDDGRWFSLPCHEECFLAGQELQTVTDWDPLGSWPGLFHAISDWAEHEIIEFLEDFPKVLERWKK